MSIEGKHAYRFSYLKSDKWSNVRIEALGRENGKCQICGEESIFNDAHHMWYPKPIWETTERHLVILCRPCHNFIHAIIPECKTNDEEKGRAHWFKFSNAIIAWRNQKLDFFLRWELDPKDLPMGVTMLRRELARVKNLLKEKESEIKRMKLQQKIKP